MSALSRTRAEFEAAWHSFIRRRTAVFFTFFFPVILIVIFGALVTTDPTGGGLFTEPPEYYLAGYLAVVVLFTPLSRVGSTVARHRDGNRFEKLATTPLSRTEWLLAHTLVNAILVGIASAILLVVLWALTDATFVLSPLLVPFVLIGSAVFCGIGALLGRVADSQDGVIAAANTIALPMLFLAETFVPPELLPDWMGSVIDLLPLTYFSRGVREVTVSGGPWITDMAILSGLALVFFLAGAYALPETD
jgi:ABC-2 type transport system permease protein